MSVPLEHQLYQAGTYITSTVRQSRNHHSVKFNTKFAVGENIYCRSGPVLACEFWSRGHEKLL